MKFYINRKVEQKKLDDTLKSHRLWVIGRGGKQADLQEADLRGADLRDADLREACLRGIDLEGAILHGADFQNSNLQDADFRRADLRGTDFSGTYLYGAIFIDALHAPITMHISPWDILIHDGQMQIGCEKHPFKDWKSFSDEEIGEMHSNASQFWDEHKNMLLAACDIYEKKKENKNG